MFLSDSIARFRVFRHGRGRAKSGSSAPGSHCHKAAFSPVALDIETQPPSEAGSAGVICWAEPL